MAERFVEPLPDWSDRPDMPPAARWLHDVSRTWRLDDAEWQVAMHIATAELELSALLAAAEDAPASVRGSKGQPVANPLFAEIRAHRKSIADLRKQLDLPSETEESMRMAKLEAALDGGLKRGRPSRFEAQRVHNDMLRAER
ncbi:hypothetical protein ACFY0A_17775 [Streptomyces sp. NPDC001698]|uniref:hypothetical protein n=1 Tax=Streptomyces sp. NPDC001698 TaxID=3364601 RepID=UPI0036822A4C